MSRTPPTDHGGVDDFSAAEIEQRFVLARQAFIASVGGSEANARAKAQMAADIPDLRSDWTYALAWALFETKRASS